MKKIALILLMVVFLPITSALAVKVANLYQTQIPVIAQTSDTKEQAVRDGFLQVLIKVTGNPDVDKNPLIRTNLKRADYFVHDYSYLSETPDAAHYLLQITYEPSDIKRLLQNAKVSYWGDSRPLILVWLVVTNKQEDPNIISNEDGSNVYKGIRQAGKKYGLPLIFPVMDVEELADVSPGDVTNVSMNVLNRAAKRYAPDAQLIGTISEDDKGVESQWQLVMNDFQWNWDISDKTLDGVISSFMAYLSKAMLTQSVGKTTMANSGTVNSNTENSTENNSTEK